MSFVVVSNDEKNGGHTDSFICINTFVSYSVQSVKPPETNTKCVILGFIDKL